MRILIRNAAEGFIGVSAYTATIEGVPQTRGGMGNTMQEAIGSCVMQNSHILGIETVYVSSPKKKPTKDKNTKS